MRFFQARRNWGMLLLAIWLIVTGVLHFTNWSRGRSDDLLMALAIAAGVLILLGR